MFAFKKNSSCADCDPVARQIAERCTSETLSQLASLAEQMSVEQLRGYIRAHAWPKVYAESEAAAAALKHSKATTNDLAAKALEQTVHLVLNAYRSVPVVAMPTPHIGRRAA